MTFSWGNSSAIAEHLDQVFPEQDLLSLDLVTLECLIKSHKIAQGRVPPLDIRENVLKSILWQWMRLRDQDHLQKRQTG